MPVDQPPTHKGLLRKLDETLVELEPWRREWFDDLRAQPSAPTLDAANGSTGEEDGDEADRRQAGKTILVGGLAAAAFPLDMLERIAHHGDRPIDSRLITAHEDLADALASFHRITPPSVLGRLVANQADMLLGLLDCPMSPAVRARLDATAVGSHGQAGLLAFFAGDRTTARRMLAVAEKVAADADDQDPLRAQVLGAASVPYSEGIGNDAPRAARMLSEAVDHARRSDARTRGWLHAWLAKELAATGDRRGFDLHIRQAERLAVLDTATVAKDGFFARYAADEAGNTKGRMGSGLAMLGYADEALKVLASAQGLVGSRWRVSALAQTATAMLAKDEPDQTCADLVEALDTSVGAGYVLGLKRIRGVRAQFPESWAGLPCVQELDERLRLIAT